MQCPRLEDLPSPPTGKTGWPWTEASAQAAPLTSTGCEWPRISIVTPSYNQGQYIEETVRSILLQGYPNLEYFVIDGGSTDATHEIIKKYEHWLTFWVSERDQGQSSAINKGLRRAKGDVFNWINSDDLLLPQSLQLVAEAYSHDKGSLLAGDVLYRYEGLRKEERASQADLDFRCLVEFWNNSMTFCQQGIFVPMFLMNKVGDLDEGLHYAFDYDLFCRLTEIAPVVHLDYPLAIYRYHPSSKSVDQSARFLPEVCAVSRRFWTKIPDLGLPASDPRGAGLLLRVGSWQIFHGDLRGMQLLKESLRLDALRAISSNLLYFPQWMLRRWYRGTPKW